MLCDLCHKQERVSSLLCENCLDMVSRVYRIMTKDGTVPLERPRTVEAGLPPRGGRGLGKEKEMSAVVVLDRNLAEQMSRRNRRVEPAFYRPMKRG